MTSRRCSPTAIPATPWSQPGDHLARAQREREGLAAPARVELRAVGKPARVVDDRGLTRRDGRAAPLLDDLVVETGIRSLHRRDVHVELGGVGGGGRIRDVPAGLLGRRRRLGLHRGGLGLRSFFLAAAGRQEGRQQDGGHRVPHGMLAFRWGCGLVTRAQESSSSRTGFSRRSFTLTRNETASSPSTIR